MELIERRTGVILGAERVGGGGSAGRIDERSVDGRVIYSIRAQRRGGLWHTERRPFDLRQTEIGNVQQRLRGERGPELGLAEQLQLVAAREQRQTGLAASEGGGTQRGRLLQTGGDGDGHGAVVVGVQILLIPAEVRLRLGLLLMSQSHARRGERRLDRRLRT